jgi:hypothetical protein
MNILLTFFVIVAWVVGPLTLLLGCLHVNWAAKYPGSLEEALDHVQGMRKVFQPLKWFGISLVCWAYIGAYYFS